MPPRLDCYSPWPLRRLDSAAVSSAPGFGGSSRFNFRFPMMRRLCVFTSLLQNVFIRVASCFKRTTGIEVIAFQNFGHVGLLARWDNRNARLLHAGKSIPSIARQRHDSLKPLIASVIYAERPHERFTLRGARQPGSLQYRSHPFRRVNKRPKFFACQSQP